jgi:hypothetical protein
MADNNNDVVTLWQAQSSDGFRISTEEIQRRIETMNRKLRRRTIDGYLICAVLTIFFIGWMFVETNALQAVGSILTIIGAGYLAWQIRQNQFRVVLTGDVPLLQHLRGELARQRDFHWSALFWRRIILFAPGPLIFLAGFAHAHPEIGRMIRFETISFIVIAVSAIPLNLRMARRYQRQIDDLTHLQEEQ